MNTPMRTKVVVLVMNLYVKPPRYRGGYNKIKQTVHSKGCRCLLPNTRIVARIKNMNTQSCFLCSGKEGSLPSEPLTVSDHSCNTGFERIREDEFLCWHFISL
jgi:hypothetical protein